MNYVVSWLGSGSGLGYSWGYACLFLPFVVLSFRVLSCFAFRSIALRWVVLSCFCLVFSSRLSSSGAVCYLVRWLSCLVGVFCCRVVHCVGALCCVMRCSIGFSCIVLHEQVKSSSQVHSTEWNIYEETPASPFTSG
jgi:hypothetical protein